VIKLRRNAKGVVYMVRQGVLIDAGHRYFVSVGRSLADNDGVVAKFTRNYFALLPLMLLSISLLGWFAAGRALRPVTDLAATAQAISSANLGLRIPQRGASDELDHLIATFNNMVGRLENSFVLTRQFSTDVSHELRTPLTAIRGQLEVALFAARTVEEHREAIINALQDVERLSQIVRALLHLSQAESGQLALQKSKLDVVPLLRDIVEQFQIPAEAGRVELSADLPEQCWLDADRIQMERLVTNLLSNAVKFTPTGGAVRVRLRQTQGWAELEVEDSGQGIAVDHLPHIFDRFYRVPAATDGREKGLGLGLSFVAWIVKAHEGRIDVESAVGKGSCFRVSLRTVAPDAAPAPEKESVNTRDAVL
jgi:heavy metal sensor kinase